MGKKKKNKLKKKLIKQRLAALEQQGLKEETKTSASQIKQVVETKEERGVEKNKGQNYIKKDLKKVALIGAVLAIIFIILIVLKVKTGYINSAGDWLFAVLNVG